MRVLKPLLLFRGEFVCTEGYPGFENPAQECAEGATCIPKFDYGTSGVSCGGALEGQVPVNCTAQGDTGAFCVYGDHCACSEGYLCGLPDGSEGGAAQECEYGEKPGIVLPEPKWEAERAPLFSHSTLPPPDGGKPQRLSGAGFPLPFLR